MTVVDELIYEIRDLRETLAKMRERLALAEQVLEIMLEDDNV